MECPHLDKTSPSHPTPLTILESIEELKCSECVSKESVWLCITCGVLSCGRYVKAHGLKHKENKHDIFIFNNRINRYL